MQTTKESAVERSAYSASSTNKRIRALTDRVPWRLFWRHFLRRLQMPSSDQVRSRPASGRGEQVEERGKGRRERTEEGMREKGGGEGEREEGMRGFRVRGVMTAAAFLTAFS